MTLQASGPITLADITAEFSLAASAIFPTAFYGLGGAPASGPLSFGDFYGRSATVTPVITTNDSSLDAFGFSQNDNATISTTGGRTITSITLVSGDPAGRVALGGTGGVSTTITLTTPGSGNGSISGVYRVTCSTGEFVEIPFTAEWGIA